MLSDPVIALVWAAGVVAFGVTGRLIEMLSIDPDAAPEQILKNVRRSVDVFVEKTEQFDDLTMLCLSYKGPCRGDGNTENDVNNVQDDEST